MHRACVAVIGVLLVWPLSPVRAGATDEVANEPALASPDLVEEVLVEAREPRYAAPTLRDRIGRVWVPVMINGKGRSGSCSTPAPRALPS